MNAEKYQQQRKMTFRKFKQVSRNEDDKNAEEKIHKIVTDIEKDNENMISLPKERKGSDEFVKSLEGLDEAALRELENKIIDESDEYQKSLNEKMFALPAKGYNEMAKAVHLLLNKQTSQWQYTLGLVTMYEFWDENKRPKEVNYPTLDGTLRTLGSLSFTGYDEWKAVLTINNYFEPMRAKYVELTNQIYFNAEKHNAVMDKLKIYDPNIPTVDVDPDGRAKISEGGGNMPDPMS